MPADKETIRSVIGSLKIQRREQDAARLQEDIDRRAALELQETERIKNLKEMTKRWVDTMLAAGSPGAELITYEKKSRFLKARVETFGWPVASLADPVFEFYGHRSDLLYLLADGMFIIASESNNQCQGQPYELSPNPSSYRRDMEDQIPARISAIAEKNGIDWS